MRKIKITTHTFIISLFIISCIKEDLSNCPYFGLYRVIFTDSLKNTNNFGGNSIVCYSQTNGDNCGEMHFTLHPDSSFLIPRHTYRMSPGIYSFKALFYSGSAECTPPVILQNGIRYMYASTEQSITKKARNIVPLLFKPANSIIAIRFHLKEPGYNILLAEITPPKEQMALFNFETGLCSHETEISGYYIKCTHDNNSNIWSTYCNPLSANNYINIRVTLFESTSDSQIRLSARQYIATHINQGELYLIEADITPHRINIKSGNIKEWEEFSGGTVIISNN